MQIHLDKRRYRMMSKPAGEATRQAFPISKTNRSGYNPTQRQMQGEAQPNDPDWKPIFHLHSQQEDVMLARDSPLGR